MDAPAITQLVAVLRTQPSLPPGLPAADHHPRPEPQPYRLPDLPILVGHTSQLATARDFVTNDTSGIPVIAMRQEDGTVKAFLNVCRHRGVRVVNTPAGNRRSFTCPYHGWTYGPDGCLLGIPFRQAFDAVRRDERGLREIPVAIRNDLVWVGVQPGSTIDIAAVLGTALTTELDGEWLQNLRVERWEREYHDLDWRVALGEIRASYRRTEGPDRGRFFVDALDGHARTVAGPDLVLGGNGLSSRPADLLGRLTIAYDLTPHDLLAWRGTHVELWSVHPQPGPGVRAAVRLTMLVPDKDRAPQDSIWETALARLPTVSVVG